VRKRLAPPSDRGREEQSAGARNLNLIGNIISNVLVFVALAFGGGLGTAWYMIEGGSRLSTRTFGPWTTWVAAGRPDADPYTRAHTARDGLLPLATTLELTYRAKADSAGGRLHSGCEYTIVMDNLDGTWWSLGAFDSKGGLIQNPAERYGYNRDTAMREPDGRAVITLARDARPGNWLPIGGGSRINLVFTVDDPSWAAAMYEGGAVRSMPQIQKTSCR
jgi:hypothetical protein